MRLCLRNRPLGFVPAFLYFFELTRGHLSTTDTVPFPKESVLEKIGVLLESNLSGKFQINNVALKISKTVGVVARLRHFVPRTTLLNIYQSLIFFYLTYHDIWFGGLGSSCQNSFTKILVLQKRVLRLMYFSEPRAHAVPLVISSKILPLQMLYAEKVSSIVFDVSCVNAPSNICDFFTRANSKHKHETRFSSSGNYYVQTSRVNVNKILFPGLELNFGTQFLTNFVESPKELLKKNFHNFLLSIMEADDDYVEVPILLQKMANSASSTQCTNNR